MSESVKYSIVEANAGTNFIKVKFVNPFEGGVDSEKTMSIANCYKPDGNLDEEKILELINAHGRTAMHRFTLANDVSSTIKSKTARQTALDSILKAGTEGTVNIAPPVPPEPAPEENNPPVDDAADDEEELDAGDEDDDGLVDEEPAPTSGGGL